MVVVSSRVLGIDRILFVTGKYRWPISGELREGSRSTSRQLHGLHYGKAVPLAALRGRVAGISAERSPFRSHPGSCPAFCSGLVFRGGSHQRMDEVTGTTKYGLRVSRSMRVLVTGGAGFIGSHITETLLAKDHRVVVLDNLDPYYDLGIKEHNVEVCRDAGGDRFTFVEGSMTDEELVEEVFDEHGVEFVYHEAARAGVRTSVEQPTFYEENNVGGLLTLLEAAVDADVERFVNASSSSVYGRPDYLPYDEEHPNYPKSPYAVTKLAAEHYCTVYSSLHGLPTVSLRYFTVYGPRMRPNMAISNFVSRCVNGGPPVIYGDGEQTRDFTHIDDVVEANLTLLETDAADSKVLNIGSTDNITINELAEHVIAETGVDVESVHQEAREADARHTHADVSKARDLLGYDPDVDIREGVSRFIRWYRANREWYEPLVLE